MMREAIKGAAIDHQSQSAALSRYERQSIEIHSNQPHSRHTQPHSQGTQRDALDGIHIHIHSGTNLMAERAQHAPSRARIWRAQMHFRIEQPRRPQRRVHPLGGERRPDHLMREALKGVIRGHQRPSVVISGHQRSSEVVRGHQRSSAVGSERRHEHHHGRSLRRHRPRTQRGRHELCHRRRQRGAFGCAAAGPAAASGGEGEVQVLQDDDGRCTTARMLKKRLMREAIKACNERDIIEPDEGGNQSMQSARMRRSSALRTHSRRNLDAIWV